MAGVAGLLGRCMTGVRSIQRALDARADPKVKAWWEKYMRGVLPFRGVPMAGIREVVLAHPASKDLALRLLRQKHSEDKIAGILMLQRLELDVRDLDDFAALFEDGSIADWSTCDWFCVKVLGPLIARRGEAMAQAIAEWRHSENLWQRRAAGVAFVNLVRRGDYADLVLTVCEAPVQSPERFAQTGTGWLLRELSHAEPERVAAFVRRHRKRFSSEGLRMATAKLKSW